MPNLKLSELRYLILPIDSKRQFGGIFMMSMNNGVSKFDFVYSNALDQAWNPRAALVTWLNQLSDIGVLVIEHTEAHGPEGASEMDPFGVRPTVVPYVLSEWFGYGVSVRFVKSRKGNNGLDVWLFFIKKNLSNIN